jgi:ABC-type multidrug transport system fused ATPase/permease subunit
MIVELIAAYLLTLVIVKGNSIISKAIDTLLSGKMSGIVDMQFIGQLFIFVGIGFMASIVRDMSASKFSVNIQKELRKQTTRKLVRLEYKYFDKNATGSILNKFISDIGAAGNFFSGTLPDICRTLIETITIIISIGQMDGMLVLFLAAGYPIIMLMSNFASKRIASLAKNRRQKIDVLNSRAYDNIQGILVGRSFNLVPIMKKKIYEANDEIMKFEFKRNKMSSVSWIMNNLINWLPRVILATLALMRVLKGSITVGQMTFFILMLDRILNPLSELPGLFNDARELGVSIHRLEEIMEEADEPSGSFNEKSVVNISKDAKENAIEFKNVNFGYNENTHILKDLSFRVEAGKNVAFVGGSGEGKSTIFKLLCGFYQKQSGSYKLFGRDFEEWDVNGARNLYSLVSQNVFLFPQTIAENVAYGLHGATLEQIQEACKLANIHDFIMSLPEQYDTLAGERGARLSGGERQRISIARAFLKNAPILLLDEPTSAIDVGTENLIKEAIERISKGRTVITIAHRLSTIEDADTIMVLSNGLVAESGTNEELLARKGIYYHLYEVQSQVREEEGSYEVEENTI